MTRKATAADYGLVALVGGGAALLLVGMATIGVSAFLGRIPVVLATLLGLSLLITLVGLVITVVTRQRTDEAR